MKRIIFLSSVLAVLALGQSCNCSPDAKLGDGGDDVEDAGDNLADAGTGDDAGAQLDGGADDAGVDVDAGVSDAGCVVGSAMSAARPDSLDLFGIVSYYADGGVLPSGHYQVQYEDGCMKYSGSQGWTIHAYADGAIAAWWLVGETSAQRIAVPPGTVGYYTTNGAFATFDECVAANLLLSPVEFDFDGGVIGVWLLDSNYPDNLAGVDGRNPKWKLTRQGACQ